MAPGGPGKHSAAPMSQWISDVLAARDFWISASVAVLFFLGGKFYGVAVRTFRVLLYRHQQFSITGFWIGNCVLPSVPDRYLVEVWKIVQRGENVHLQMFSYYPDGRIDRCLGSGIFRGSLLSALYYTCGAETCESGALALRLKGNALVGSYAQYDVDDATERFFSSDSSYTLSRLPLSLGRKILMILGRPPFPGYPEIDAQYVRHHSQRLPAIREHPAPSPRD